MLDQHRALKRTSLEFRDLASRLLRSDAEEARGNIRRLLRFVALTPHLAAEIERAPKPSIDLGSTWSDIQNSRNDRFPLPEDPLEELGVLHGLLLYLSQEEAGTRDFWQLCYGYAGATSLRECVSEVLHDIGGKYVDHLNRVLEIALLDSGNPAYEPRRVQISIAGGGNQLNIAHDNSTLNAQLNSGAQLDEIMALVDQLQHAPEANETVHEVAAAVRKELTSGAPNKFTLKAARTALEDIAATATASSTIAAAAMRLGTALGGLL